MLIAIFCNWGLFISHLNKRDDFDFPIVNFPFLSSNIPTCPAYGVYISQLIRYCRACNVYSDFLNRTKLLSQKLLGQGYVQPLLISSLQTFYGRHHNFTDRYDISISQMRSDIFQLIRPLLPDRHTPDLAIATYWTFHLQCDGCHAWSRSCLPFRSTWWHYRFFVGLTL